MRFHDLARSSWQSLLRTRNRSVLTMLGIVIGISAVILSLSIGESAQSYIMSQMSSFGSDTLYVHTGSRTVMENPSPFVEWSLTMKDAERLKRENWVQAITGQSFETDTISARGTTKNISVYGTLPDEPIVGGYEVADGVFFSQSDLDGHARAVVLGAKIADDIFGQDRAVGQTVKIGDTPYRVSGVLKVMGSRMMLNLDELVFVPATTLADITHNKYFHYLILKTNIDLNDAQRRIEDILRDMHDISNPENDPAKDDFFVMTQADAVKMVDQVLSALEILLSSIAAISLLVGGIGIMNIMFVSVTERISEIGLRKALGARSKDVLAQFLAEAMFLTICGGVLGVLFGSLCAWVAIQIINSYMSGWSFVVSLRGALLGVTVSTAIGLVFGYFPARRAARLRPIESLRAE